MNRHIKIAVSTMNYPHPAPKLIAVDNTEILWSDFKARLARSEMREAKGGHVWTPHWWPESITGGPCMDRDVLVDVREVYCVLLDLDSPQWDEVDRFLSCGLEGVVYSTFNHYSPNMHMHAVLLLEEPVSFVQAVKVRNAIARSYFKRWDFTTWRYYLPSFPRWTTGKPWSQAMQGALVRAGDWK